MPKVLEKSKSRVGHVIDPELGSEAGDDERLSRP
jgi:hypothetical protein